MIQTLHARKDLLPDLNPDIIMVDEVHDGFKGDRLQELFKCYPKAKILGLTATPYRKDGLEKILFQQCGPIRYEMKLSDRANLIKIVHFHETGFKVPEELGQKPPYHLLIQHLVTDLKRNQIIANLAVNAINKKRVPILISDRKDHLDLISNLISTTSPGVKIVQIDGDLTTKKRKLALADIEASVKAREQVLLMATASLIGEGFDLPELDTLILASPLSFEGRIVQYAGRLHRSSEGKSDVRIIDFIDSFSAIFSKMYRNRLKAYRKMGYSVNMQGSLI
jgi:superfamily II DNA or RNA helicase